MVSGIILTLVIVSNAFVLVSLMGIDRRLRRLEKLRKWGNTNERP